MPLCRWRPGAVALVRSLTTGTAARSSPAAAFFAAALGFPVRDRLLGRKTGLPRSGPALGSWDRHYCRLLGCDRIGSRLLGRLNCRGLLLKPRAPRQRPPSSAAGPFGYRLPARALRLQPRALSLQLLPASMSGIVRAGPTRRAAAVSCCRFRPLAPPWRPLADSQRSVCLLGAALAPRRSSRGRRRRDPRPAFGLSQAVTLRSRLMIRNQACFWPSPGRRRPAGWAALVRQLADVDEALRPSPRARKAPRIDQLRDRAVKLYRSCTWPPTPEDRAFFRAPDRGG